MVGTFEDSEVCDRIERRLDSHYVKYLRDVHLEEVDAEIDSEVWP